MDVAPWLWWATVLITTGLLLVDVLVIGRRPHEPETRELVTHLAFFVGLAVLFGLGVWLFAGAQYGGEFFAGWLTEYSLSVDNLFIFIIIMAKLAGAAAVPADGAADRHRDRPGPARHLHRRRARPRSTNFSWIFYLFGAFLIYTAIKLAKDDDDDDEQYEEPRIVAVRRKRPAGHRRVERRQASPSSRTASAWSRRC